MYNEGEIFVFTMKKILAILIVLFLTFVFAVYTLKINKESNTRALKKYNVEYENYLNKEIFGAELATLINKTVSLNEKNNIAKDKHNHFIENEESSIKIEIKINFTDKTYSMEEFYNNDTAEFVKYFELEKFKCTSIEYHKKNGKVSKLSFEQI